MRIGNFIMGIGIFLLLGGLQIPDLIEYLIRLLNDAIIGFQSLYPSQAEIIPPAMISLLAVWALIILRVER